MIKRILYFLIPTFYVLHVLSLMVSMAGMEFFGWGGLILILISEVYERIVNKHTLFVSHPFNKYVILLGLAFTASVLLSPYLSETQYPWHFYIGRSRYLILFFYHVTALTYFVNCRSLIKWLPVVILPIVLLFILDAASGLKLFKNVNHVRWNWHFPNGIRGNFVHYIEFATIFEMFLLLLTPMVVLRSYSIKYKILLVTTITTLMFALAASGTRAFFIALPAGLLTQVLFSQRKRTYIIISIICLIAFAGAYKINKYVQKRAGYTISNIDKLGDPKRYNLWKAHFMLFADHPISGGGLYVITDSKFLDPYYKELNTNEKETYRGLTHAHNNYIDILSGTGILGFISFILFMAMLIKYTLQSRKIAIKNNMEYEQLLSSGIIGVIACLMTNMMVDTSLQMIKVCYSFMFIAGLSIYLNNKLRKLN